MADAATEQTDGTDARTSRVDVAAMRDRRALLMLPVIAGACALPFVTRAAESLWIDGSAIAQWRLFIRLAMTFLLCACYPATLFLVRIGLTDVTASQHRALLRAYPTLTTAWQSLVALDGFVLVAAPRYVSLPNFAFDVALSVASAVLIPFIMHHQTFFFGFDAEVLRRARGMLTKAPELAHARAPLDTLD